MKSRTILKKLLSIDTASNPDILAEKIRELQELAKIELNTSNERNRQSYAGDIEKSRLQRTINNSRQAIKKLFPDRHSDRLWNGKTNKELIFNHISKLRELNSQKEKIFGLKEAVNAVMRLNKKQSTPNIGQRNS